jgi:hypothetical protein
MNECAKEKKLLLLMLWFLPKSSILRAPGNIRSMIWYNWSGFWDFFRVSAIITSLLTWEIVSICIISCFWVCSSNRLIKSESYLWNELQRFSLTIFLQSHQTNLWRMQEIISLTDMDIVSICFFHPHDLIMYPVNKCTHTHTHTHTQRPTNKNGDVNIMFDNVLFC